MSDITISLDLDSKAAEAAITRLVRKFDALTLSATQSGAALAQVTRGLNNSASGLLTASGGVEKVVQSLDKLVLSQNKSGQATQAHNTALGSLAQTIRLIDGPLGGIASRFTAVESIVKKNTGSMLAFNLVLGTVGVAITGLVAAGTVFQQLQNRIKSVSGDGTDLQATFSSLLRVANESRTSLKELASTYQVLARSTRDLNLDQGTLFTLTSNVSKAIQLGGTSAQEAVAGLRQFGQALSFGQLRGQELNSFLKETPGLAKALADGLGVTTAKLVSLARAGQLTTPTILVALLKQTDDINERFNKLSETVPQAFTKLVNSAEYFGGKLDETTGLSKTLAGGIDYLTDHMESLFGVFQGIAEVLAQIGNGFRELANSGIGQFLESIPAPVMGAIIGGGIGLAGGPIGAIVGAGAGAIVGGSASIDAAFFKAKADAFKTLSDAQKTAAETTDLLDSRYQAAVLAGDKYAATIDKMNEKTKQQVSLLRDAAQAKLDDLNKQIAAATPSRTNVITNGVLGDGQLVQQNTPAQYVPDQFNLQLKNLKTQATAADQAVSVLNVTLQKFDKDTQSSLFGTPISPTPELTSQQTNFIKKTQEEIGALSALNSYVGDTSQGFEDYKKHQEAVAKIQELGLPISYKVINAITGQKVALIDLIDEENRQKDLARAIDADLKQNDKLKDAQDLLAAARQGTQAYLDEKDAIEAKNEAIATGHKLNTTSYDDYVAQQIKIKEITEQTKVLTDEQKKQQEVLNRAAESIYSAYENVFEKILRTGKLSFKSLADDIKGIFAKTLAEMLALALAKPIIVPVIEAFGSATGFDSGAISKATAPFGGGTGGSSFGGIGNLFTGASRAVDTFGTNYLGLSEYSSPIGPTLSGAPLNATLGTGSLSSLLGAAGIGAGIGGLVGQFTGGNAVGSSLGGAGGAALGSAILPGIGTLIGGVLGGGLGGLFGGGNNPHPASTFSGTLGDSGAFSTSSILSKHQDGAAASAAGGTLTGVSQQLAAAGIDLTGLNVSGGYDSGKGGSIFQVGNNSLIKFDASNAQAADDALKQLTIELAKAGKVTNDDVTKALKNLQTEGKSAAQVLATILDAATLKTRQKAFQQQIGTDIANLLDPNIGQLVSTFQSITNDLQTASSLQLDLTQVELKGKLQLLDLNKKINATAKDSAASLSESLQTAQGLVKDYASVADSLQSAITGLSLGGTSSLTPQQRLDLAQSQFQSTLGLAQGGDLKSLQALPDAAQSFAEQNQSFFGTSSAAGAANFNDILSGLNSAKTVATGQIDYQQQIADTAQKQLDVLNKIEDDLSTKILNVLQGATVNKDGTINTSGGVAKNSQEVIGRALGFTGNYGGGAYTNYLAQTGQTATASALNNALGNTVTNTLNSTVTNRNWGANPTLNQALALSTGYLGDFGGGLFQSWITQQSESIKAPARSIITSSGGTPGFDTGGMIQSGVLSKVHAGEMLYIGAEARAYNPRMTGWAANDNTAAQNIGELRDVMKTLVNLMAHSGTMQIEHLAAIEESLNGIESNSRRRDAA